MKLFVHVLLICLTSFILGTAVVQAVSVEQAYQDYLYQYDVYRQKLNEFKIAKNEYEKFKTLNSQATALDKTKGMLTSRAYLLRSYLLLLNEKLNENKGMSDKDKQLYQTLLTNEVSFLETHSQLIPSIALISDAQNVSDNLAGHYQILQTSIRQTIIGLSIGGLNTMASQFDTATRDTLSIVNLHREKISVERQSTIDRWIDLTNNKKQLFNQKLSNLITKNAGLNAYNLDSLDDQFTSLKKDVADAKGYLQEGTNYLTEILNAIQYVN